ncbi:MAG TPA: ligand-gated channel protein, partial [Polyangiales bacterium]|nr:ligand-gated channel protein [Polyangiales bacterium]
AQMRIEHHRFENVLFGKSYVYRADGEDIRSYTSDVKPVNKNYRRFGAGDSLRITLIDDWLLAKTSYEYTARLPNEDEVFGDAVLVYANLELRPELSHNLNQELQLDLRRTRYGDFWAMVNLFTRWSDELIFLLGQDRFSQYQNVYSARSFGVESAFKWTSPKRYVTLDGNLTVTDLRNTSTQGVFAKFDGDRVPNRPWLHASWGALLYFSNVLMRGDSIEPFYQGRYVKSFARSWESVGSSTFKRYIPDQTSHTLGLTYAVRAFATRLFGTFEVQNLTNAALFDSYGLQRPGRGYFFKLSGEI